jgi:hypothetical protein
VSSCGSKAPSDSNGFCPKVGDTRLDKGFLEICLLRDKKFAWFSKSPEIDSLVAVGRSIARIAASDTDAWNTLLDELNLNTDADSSLVWHNLKSTEFLTKSISIVAADDQSWDELQVSLGKFQSAEANWKLATDDWSQLGIRAILNKESISFDERQKATKEMNDAADRMQNIFDYEVAPNLKPFISSILRKIGIQDETMAVKLTLKYLNT